MVRQNPVIIDNIFHKKDIEEIKNLTLDYKNFYYDPGFGRYTCDQNNMPILKTLSEKLIPMSKYIFNSNSIRPTYALFAHYEGKNASLYKHKDNNACTYTIDYCLYQNQPWDLFVEDNSYTLQENQALAYYGNDQMHWREKFPNPETNKVAMIFFHFAEPDHWWFTKGSSYLKVIDGTMTESEWAKSFNMET